MHGQALQSSPRVPNGGRAVRGLLPYAFAIWTACAATIGIGRAVTSMETTLVAHAVAAPVFAAVASACYFRRHGETSPLLAASVVLMFIVLVDFFLVALVINRSLEMFRSVLGTWLPFTLIFTATATTGWILRATRPRSSRRAP